MFRVSTWNFVVMTVYRNYVLFKIRIIAKVGGK